MFSSFIHKDTLVIKTNIYAKSKLNDIKNSSGELLIKKYKSGSIEMKHEIDLPKLYYVDWFWRHVKTGNLSFEIFSLFPNIKEQSESVGAYLTLYKHLKMCLDNSDIIVIADGINPRTASLFAHFHPTSRVFSIDPIMKEKQSFLPNLTCHTQTIQDFVATTTTRFSTQLYIVAIHPHVLISDYIDDLLKLYPKNCEIVLMSMPCCFKQVMPNKSFTQIYTNDDMNILSEKRKIIVWKKFGI